MAFRLVLVERVRPNQDQVLCNSGILIDEKFVMVTSSLFMDEVKNIDWKSNQIPAGKLHSDVLKGSNLNVNVLWKNGELYVNKKAKVRWMFLSNSVRNSDRNVFQNWAIDTIDNNTYILEILSVFFVAVLEDTEEYSVSEIESVFKKWWREIVHLRVQKGHCVRVNSAPFGSRLLLDSCSKGIVSNVFGCDSCILVSDCPTTPGSEGSPVYLDSSSVDIPLGMVLTSANWWRGEWLSMTVIVDIRTLLYELLKEHIVCENSGIGAAAGLAVVTPLELSLVQIYSGSNWGTGILLNEDQGIFITNSHILTDENITLHYRQNSFKAKLVFKTPEDEIYDLAIVKCEDIVKKTNMRAIAIAESSASWGDTVYAAGFSIFSKEAKPTPTLTRGCVSGVNSFMLRTTCCVHAGASGGAILDETGHLLGIIVCNVRIHETNAVFARVNMAIPTEVFRNVVTEYMKSNDLTILNELHTTNEEARTTWVRLEAKL